MGDLTKEKLIDAWAGDYYKQIRELLSQGRDKIKICEYCDNFGGFGTNQSKDYVFTEKQFKKSWDYIKEIMNEK